MIKIAKNSPGFTLMELLVATSVVMTCATIIVAIIVSTFRQTSGINSTERVRVAGTTTLNQIITTIKTADSFDGAYTLSGDKLVSYINNSGAQACEAPDPNSDFAPTVDAIKITTDGVQKTIQCSLDTLLVDGQPVLDANLINTKSCSMECTQISSADPPVITISLDLATYNQSGSTLPETNTNISQLSQTVKMTNLHQ
jgi:hypothetical protein